MERRYPYTPRETPISLARALSRLVAEDRYDIYVDQVEDLINQRHPGAAQQAIYDYNYNYRHGRRPILVFWRVRLLTAPSCKERFQADIH